MPQQGETTVGGLKTRLLMQGMVLFVEQVMTTGRFVTVIVWLQKLLRPQQSVINHFRVVLYVQGPRLVVTSLPKVLIE